MEFVAAVLSPLFFCLFVCCLDHLDHDPSALNFFFIQMLEEVSYPGISSLSPTSLILMMWIWHRPGGDHPWEGKDEVGLSMCDMCMLHYHLLLTEINTHPRVIIVCIDSSVICKDQS